MTPWCSRWLEGLRILKTPLYRNSLYILLTSMINSVMGVLFWIVATAMYSAEEVGITSGLVALVSLPIALTRFGLDQSLIRFFPDGSKNSILATTIVITTVSSMIVGFVISLGVSLISDDLSLIRQHMMWYIAFVFAGSLLSILTTSFVALRQGKAYLLQNVLVHSKILFAFPLVALGVVGLFYSYGFSVLLAVLFGYVLLLKHGVKPRGFDKDFLRSSWLFSAGNYFVSLLMTVPVFVLPILVINVLGPEDAGRYYIAYTISAIFFIVPGSFSLSLFVEGSHGEPTRINAIRAMKSSFYLLIPGVVLILLFAESILGVLGDAYVGASTLMRTMVLSSFLVTIWSVFYSVKRIQKDIHMLAFVGALISIVVMVLSYCFMSQMGIDGMGYAWISGYGVGSVAAVLIGRREKWI